MKCRFCMTDLRDGAIVCHECDRYIHKGWRNWLKEGGLIISLAMLLLSIAACAEARRERLKTEVLKEDILEASKIFGEMIIAQADLSVYWFENVEPIKVWLGKRQLLLMEELGVSIDEREGFVKELLNNDYEKAIKLENGGSWTGSVWQAN